MLPRSTTRRAAIWTSACAFTATLVAWVFSAFACIRHEAPQHDFALYDGRLLLLSTNLRSIESRWKTIPPRFPPSDIQDRLGLVMPSVSAGDRFTSVGQMVVPLWLLTSLTLAGTLVLCRTPPTTQLRSHPRIYRIARCAGAGSCLIVGSGACLSFQHTAMDALIIKQIWLRGPQRNFVTDEFNNPILTGTENFMAELSAASGWVIMEWGSVPHYDQSVLGGFSDDPMRRFAVPLVPLAMLSGLVALLALYLGRRARTPGSCVDCGYNLTGNTSGRCPECGVACTSELNIDAKA